jgi:uncharacterized damage-inducible protein DinB
MRITDRIDWLLAYTEWDRAQWEPWFRENPSALGASYGANATGKITNVGELVRHIFAGEQRFSDRIEGKEPATLFEDVPANDVAALFDLGRRTRANFRHVLRDTPVARWSERYELTLGPRKLSIVPTTMAAQILVHEVRHWAQVAILLRIAGFKPGLHELVASGVFESGKFD